MNIIKKIDEYDEMEVENTNDKSLDYKEELIDDETPEILYENIKVKERIE